MGQRIDDLDAYIKEAIANIRNDRDTTSDLLTDLVKELKNASGSEAHKELGLIASKYVETLQRSNEQLVKISSIISKKTEASVSLNTTDKNELFDIIQGEKNR